MKRMKFLSINCGLLGDHEFEAFIRDVEAYCKTRKDRGIMPQKKSEEWLEEFAASFEKWEGRLFFDNSLPIIQYFCIDIRNH